MRLPEELQGSLEWLPEYFVWLLPSSCLGSRSQEGRCTLPPSNRLCLDKLRLASSRAPMFCGRVSRQEGIPRTPPGFRRRTRPSFLRLQVRPRHLPAAQDRLHCRVYAGASSGGYAGGGHALPPPRREVLRRFPAREGLVWG